MLHLSKRMLMLDESEELPPACLSLLDMQLVLHTRCSFTAEVPPSWLPYTESRRVCGCRSALDLMDRMLQPNPEGRIDIAGILSHEWFGRSLQSVALSVNKGLLEMPDSMLTGSKPQTASTNIFVPLNKHLECGDG